MPKADKSHFVKDQGIPMSSGNTEYCTFVILQPMTNNTWLMDSLLHDLVSAFE